MASSSTDTASSTLRLMPLADASAPFQGLTHPRLSHAVTLAMGAALLWFGWIDTRAYLSGATKPPLAYSLTALPGGTRMGPALEFFHGSDGGYLRLENFWALEFGPHHPYRHGLGPVSTLEIFSQSPTAHLSFRFVSDWPEQSLAVACNGQEVGRIAPLPAGVVARTYPLALHPGGNAVTFTYQHYNHDGTCETGDARPLAGMFLSLDLTLP